MRGPSHSRSPGGTPEGDAQRVELAATPGLAALTAGFEFVEGGEYLISASGDAVSLCGYSGPATAELRAHFEATFGS